MLHQLRQSASSWVVKILFGILVASFAVWGIGDIFRGPGRDAVVAEVGDRAITGNELISEFQRQIEQLRPDSVLQQMVARAAFDAAASDLGLAISDDVVRTVVTADRNFQSAGGSFDTFVYEQRLRSAGFTKQSYEAALRRELAREQLASTIQAGAKAPESLVETLYLLRQEKRVADVVTVPSSRFTDVGEPGEAELAAFHREQEDRFTAPEYRSLTAVRMEAKDLADEIAIPEEEVRQAYDSNLGRFVTPGRRNVRQILVDGEEAARRAHMMLSQGMGFAEVAKEVAGQEEADIAIGWVTKDGLLPELVDPAFALQEAGFSDPIESALGWHILEVTGVEREVVRSFEEARQELRDDIATELALEGLYNLANRLEDELAGGASLEEVAARLNLELMRVEAIDRRGSDRDGRAVEGLPAETFVDTAFSTNKGEASLLTETPEGGYFILRVDRVTPRAVKPLESIREEVIEAWKEEQREKAAETRAKAMVDRIRGGETLADVASEMGLEIETTEPILRTDPAFHPYLLLRLFEERIGGIAAAATAGGYVVAQLKSIEAADADADKEGVRALGRELGRALAADLVAQYGAALFDRYTVKVNNRTIDALF
jgi:peptidyl-prolyl cis-trans isomerase D